jgi:formate hydrogenlyase subunit 6/NADH:ubiquinone oxidoreductase subunit I
MRFPIGSMLSDVLKAFFRKPVTQNYPFTRTAAPPAFRGRLVYDPTKCSGCQLCVKDCPSNAIELLVVDRAAKRFVLRYHEDRCTFCAQCVVNCRFKCIEMSSEQWELAALTKEPFTVYYGRDEDVNEFLAKLNVQPE